MPEKLGNSNFPDLVTPLTTPLRKGDPRCPVNNPPMLDVRDPLGYVPGGVKGGKKKSSADRYKD